MIQDVSVHDPVKAFVRALFWSNFKRHVGILTRILIILFGMFVCYEWMTVPYEARIQRWERLIYGQTAMDHNGESR